VCLIVASRTKIQNTQTAEEEPDMATQNVIDTNDIIPPTQQAAEPEAGISSTSGDSENKRLLGGNDANNDRNTTVWSNVQFSIAKLFTESVAAHMHSVGMLGENERLDDTGTLHYYVSLQRTHHTNRQRSNLLQEKHIFYYGTLDDLFHQEPIKHVETEDEDDEGGDLEETEELDVVEGGSLSAAVFGIIKGTVGPAILYLPKGKIVQTNRINQRLNYGSLSALQAFNKVDGRWPSLVWSSPRTCSSTMRTDSWNAGKLNRTRTMPLPNGFKLHLKPWEPKRPMKWPLLLLQPYSPILNWPNDRSAPTRSW
jgi:hypothetical protein